MSDNDSFNHFNVEAYLSRLSVYVYTINVAQKRLQHIPQLSLCRFSSLLGLYCYNNLLRQLPKLPDTLHTLECNENHLTTLPDLPRSLAVLIADNNILTCLPKLPQSLTTLSIQNNFIKKMPTLPTNLKMLAIKDNEFDCLPNFPEKTTVFTIDGNPIYEIIKTNKNITQLKLNIKTLNQFRRIYAANLIRNAIWRRILEPKLRQKYSPDNLLQLLAVNNIDLDADNEYDYTQISTILDGW